MAVSEGWRQMGLVTGVGDTCKFLILLFLTVIIHCVTNLYLNRPLKELLKRGV